MDKTGNLHNTMIEFKNTSYIELIKLQSEAKRSSDILANSISKLKNTINKKEIDKMNENKPNPNTIGILDLWERKIRNNIHNQKSAHIKELQDKDSVRLFLQKSIKELTSKMIEYALKESPRLEETIKYEQEALSKDIADTLFEKFPLYSDATNEAINQENSLSYKTLDWLDNVYNEVKTMLVACDTYEQEMAVLKNYGVIDENGKLDVSEV